jgi:hypothetical protein
VTLVEGSQSLRLGSDGMDPDIRGREGPRELVGLAGLQAQQEKLLVRLVEQVSDGGEDLVERLLLLDRLDESADGAARNPARGVFLGGDQVDGDVAGLQVVLQPVEHPPAVDDRQADVEGDGVDPVPVGESDPPPPVRPRSP